MNFKQYLNEWKHIGDDSCFCGHCGSTLRAVDVIRGNHMYPIGQLLRCQCGKSRIFTNTIRDPERLIDHYETGAEYTKGFCNDKRCGYCFAYLDPLLNGVDVLNAEYKADQLGCTKHCENNQNLLAVGQLNLPEGDSTRQHFIDFYKRYLDKIKMLSTPGAHNEL